MFIIKKLIFLLLEKFQKYRESNEKFSTLIFKKVLYPSKEILSEIKYHKWGDSMIFFRHDDSFYIGGYV